MAEVFLIYDFNTQLSANETHIQDEYLYIPTGILDNTLFDWSVISW